MTDRASAPSFSLLTVAIPTYNGARHLAETLHSILNQESPPFDLLVCADCSDDGTVNLVRELVGNRARIVVNEERLGLAGNWNHCMTESQSPWVSIFHQDDIMRPGHLAEVIQAIQRHEHSSEPIGLVAGPATAIDEESRPLPPSIVAPGALDRAFREETLFPPRRLLPYLTVENPLRCSAVTTKKAAHADVGGFHPSYRYVVDWDFWYRVARAWGVLWRPSATVAFRWHSASETHRLKTDATDLEETERLQARIFELDPPEEAQSRALRRLGQRKLARAYLSRAHESLKSGSTEFARHCLHRAWFLSPSVVARSCGADPRLLVQMITLTGAPGMASRWFGGRR
jgi:hypothetical protein